MGLPARGILAPMVPGVPSGRVAGQPRRIHGTGVNRGQDRAADRRGSGEEQAGNEPRAAKQSGKHPGHYTGAARATGGRRFGMRRTRRRTASTTAYFTGSEMSFFWDQRKCTMARMPARYTIR